MGDGVKQGEEWAAGDERWQNGEMKQNDRKIKPIL